MANDPEALAQLARLLGDDSLRGSNLDALRVAVDQRFERLIDGLVAEAASSDDVFDSESALSFLDSRLDFLDGLLSKEQRSRLNEALRGKIEAW